MTPHGGEIERLATGTPRGGQVRVSAITYSAVANIAFGFLDNEADILGNLTKHVDFSSERHVQDQ